MTFGGGTNKGTLNATTFTLAPSATGDFVVVAVVSESTTHYITGISSSNVTWSTLVAATTVGSDTATVFIGQVTSASSATVTLTFNSSTSTIRGHWTEFSTSVGYSSVTLDSSGIVNATTDNFPQLTPGHGSGELYFGFAVWPVSATAGSTSGYTYYVDATNDNGSCWNTSCTSSAQQPVWGGTAAAINGIAVLLYEAVTPITASGSVEMAAMALAGTGAETFTASGSVTAAPLALSGTASETFSAAGSPAMAPLALAGTGAGGDTSASGTVALAAMAPSGSGQTGGTSLSGSLAMPPPALAGTGGETFASSGSLAASPLALSGTGEGGDTSSAGSVTLAPLALSGTAGETFAVSGSLAMAPPALTGAAAGGDTGTSGSLALAPPALHGTGTGGTGTGTGLLMAIWP